MLGIIQWCKLCSLSYFNSGNLTTANIYFTYESTDVDDVDDDDIDDNEDDDDDDDDDDGLILT